jgi:hypothetical protein
MSFAIVEIESGEIVRTIASTKSGSQRQRVQAGLERNLNHEHYYICDLDAFQREINDAATQAAAPQERGRLSGLAE